MVDNACHECFAEVFEGNPWDAAGELVCPSCGARYTLEYEESWDPDSGDETCWFWLEAC